MVAVPSSRYGTAYIEMFSLINNANLVEINSQNEKKVSVKFRAHRGMHGITYSAVTKIIFETKGSLALRAVRCWLLTYSNV